jgi:hypothetical protein
MKTQILTVLTLVLMGLTNVNGMNNTSATASAGNDTTVECVLYKDSDGLMNLRMYKETDALVKIVLYDSKGNVISYKSFRKDHNVRLQYDLSESPAGKYTIKVKRGRNVLYTNTFTSLGDQVANK